MAIKTTIGSLPFKDPGKACSMVLELTPELPAWPQLPKRSFRENMYAQYSENFPGMVFNDAEEKLHVSRGKFEQDLAVFFEHYENIGSGEVDYFAISENHAEGFHVFKSLAAEKKLKAVKCQVTGPMTFGMSVKEENGRSLYYDPTMKQVVEYNCAAKALWQIAQFRGIVDPGSMVLFFDEPYLAAYGSAFTAISKEDITNSLDSAGSVVKSVYPDITIGVHCCANTDWSVLCGTGSVDIISFDAYGYFDNLMLYSDALAKFTGRGGSLAWGIVPTGEDALEKESAESLGGKLKESLDKLADKVPGGDRLRGNMYVTPACGFGSAPEKTAEKAHRILSRIKT